MQRLFALFLGLCLAAGFARAQGGSDDQYVRLYNQIQLADSLAGAGQTTEALTKYREAQLALQTLQRFNPDWNPRIVNFRLRYLAERIAALTPVVIAPAAPPPTPSGTAAPATPAAPPIPAEVAQQLAALQAQVQALQADRSTLEAKLKEALATRPAAMDPEELARAEQRVLSLSKENELLKASLAQEQTRATSVGSARALEETRAALAAANRQLAEQTERNQALARRQEDTQARLDALVKENRESQARVESATTRPDNTADLTQAREALAESNRQLAEQTARSRQLATEKDALQTRLQSLTTDAEPAEVLRAENALLKQQLAAARTPQADRTEISRQLAEARARIATLQSDAELLRLEKIALQSRIQTLAQANVPAATPVVAVGRPPGDLERIKRLETERDELKQQLDAAQRTLYGSRNASLQVRVEELNSQIANLRARIEVFEARSVPYTAEELALMRPSETRLAARETTTSRRSIRELPAGSAALVAEAQRAFAAGDFDRAEDRYLQILRRDENNAYTLANLAAIQMEQGKLDEAERNARKALAGLPNDPHALSVLGYVKFQQKQYDEALDALSRAAKLDPQNPEIQNHLGVTLSQKGLRGPAETALRRALQLKPDYGAAHNNLAVIYLTQQPPSIELARWHYQKALAAGQAKNPELERQLDRREAETVTP